MSTPEPNQADNLTTTVRALAPQVSVLDWLPDGRRPWCGECDHPTSRLVEDPQGRGLSHCQRCHPKHTGLAPSTRAVAHRPGRPQTTRRSSYPRSTQLSIAVNIIRSAAEGRAVVSANTTRRAFDGHGIAVPIRSAAFRRAEHLGILERDGHVVSTDAAGKGCSLRSYRSLLLRCQSCRTPLPASIIRDGRRTHLSCASDE